MNDVQQIASSRMERDIVSQLGYRLLGWAVVSLWATAVVVIFREFSQFPSAADQWLLWISPLMVVRGIAGTVIHHKLKKEPCFLPTLREMSRMAALFAISDVLVLLSALFFFGGNNLVGPEPLVIVAVSALTLLSLIYSLMPRLLMAIAAATLGASVVGAFLFKWPMPLDMVLVGAGVVTVTAFGVLRFQRAYLKQLERNISFEQEINEAAEANYIFNQHWSRTPVAAIDWDGNLQIKSWNPAAERLFGFSAEDAVGQPLSLVFPPKEAEDIQHEWSQADLFGIEDRVRRKARHSSGKLLDTEWFDTSLQVEGEFIGVASFVVGIDGHKQADGHWTDHDEPANSAPSPVRMAN